MRACGNWFAIGDASESPELIEEMIVTALKIARDHMSVADLKLINRSIKEMRNAAKVFAPFQHLRKVAVFGSARTPVDLPVYDVAKEFAREMVAHDSWWSPVAAMESWERRRRAQAARTVSVLTFVSHPSSKPTIHQRRSQTDYAQLFLHP